MSIISEVKCARCDRKYSGVRSRCPYCGARRIGSGKYSEEGDNSKGKMIIGVLIMAVLVVAAGILLFTAPKGEDIEEPPVTNSETISSPDMPDDTGTSGLPGLGPIVTPPSESASPESESPSQAPLTVQSIEITYLNKYIDDFTEPVGKETPLKVRIEPAGIELDEEIIWTSSNTSVFEVVPSLDGLSATVTIIGSGSARSATLTVSVAGKSAECIVRVKRS